MRRSRAMPDFFDGATDEDVHTLVIRKLKETRGRARRQDPHRPQPQRAGVARHPAVAARGDRRASRDRLAELMAALLDLAERYPDAVIPGLHASAARAGGAVAALSAGLLRDVRARLRALRRGAARARTCCRSARGALAGSGFPFDREAIARDLGFDGASRATAWTCRPTAISRSIFSTPPR